jgi:hypothetical protein
MKFHNFLGDREMRLADFLGTKYSKGLLYDDAVQLCLAIYSSRDILPAGAINEDLTMDQIAEAFSELSARGLIRAYRPDIAAAYGANYHPVDSKGHWTEIQASILKMQCTYDRHRVEILLQNEQSNPEQSAGTHHE